MDLLRQYFPEISELQEEKFSRLSKIYAYWNERINVISRKDIDNLEERHILHSLSIARFIRFKPGTCILDVGTGGGFPGIPLAIMFPEVKFTLVDSIGKKVRVVREVIKETGIQNAEAIQVRAENVEGKYEFIVSRAVTNLPVFVKWVQRKISAQQMNTLQNGILYLKGGDIEEELRGVHHPYAVYDLDTYFPLEFFNTKKLVYIAVGGKS
jgi:16S rRNA (guanine527-N7)-methyltransferase